MRLSIIPPKKTYKIDELLTKSYKLNATGPSYIIKENNNLKYSDGVMGTQEARLEADDKLISGNGKNWLFMGQPIRLFKQRTEKRNVFWPWTDRKPPVHLYMATNYANWCVVLGLTVGILKIIWSLRTFVDMLAREDMLKNLHAVIKLSLDGTWFAHPKSTVWEA